MSPGDMFVAIRGDRFDGNAYVVEAVAKGRGRRDGQRSRRWSARRGLAATPLIVVPDTIAALQTLANRVRRDSGAAVVAVTGSAGKSTTKEITAEFLAARYTVFRNRGNLNNHIGLPLSLLELRTKPDIGVLELGMNHFGEISALVKIAEPEVRVWTNVGPAHLEFFGTVDAIAEAKAEILEGADKDSLLVANADDDLVMRHAAKFARPRADVRRRTPGRRAGAGGARSRHRRHGGDRADADRRSGDSHAAAGNGKSLERARRRGGRDPLRRAARPTSSSARPRLKPVARRGEVIRAGGVTIVDDSYNSNPKALSRALAMLAGETRYARRVAVIGEMLELGAASARSASRGGRGGGAVRASASSWPSAEPTRGRWPKAPCTPGCRRRTCTTSRTARTPPILPRRS